MSKRVLISPGAHLRLERARAWLAAHSPGREVLVIGASAHAANELIRQALGERVAAFGWHRITLNQLAATLARPALTANNLVPVGRLGAEAVSVRAVRRLAVDGELGCYTPVSEGPGFARAITGVLEELRLARVGAASLGRDPGLAAIVAAYEAGLEVAGLTDWPGVLHAAADAARGEAAAHALLGLPTLIVDPAIHTRSEFALVEALIERAPDVLITLPDGDDGGRARLATCTGLQIEHEPADAGSSSGTLAALQTHLFAETAPDERVDGALDIFSAPGESRECVEIARRMLALAREGVPFDDMAVLLRTPEQYRAHLEEAFQRAGIDAFFTRGALRPDPAGRAFLALLGCKAENLSARRFAEYLSLGEVPTADAAGNPPAAPPSEDRHVAPDEELVPRVVAEAMEEALARSSGSDASRLDNPDDPVTAGTLRAPRRWERLLMEAAVIGGKDRWERRLAGLRKALALDLEEVESDNEPRAQALQRELDDLTRLETYALPLIGALSDLPREANWGEWLDALSALASRALRRPERVQSVLSELQPMAQVGPVTLNEVMLVLSPRLVELTMPASPDRYGRVFVGPVEAARGSSFAVVFVPGLAEKLFPQKIAEEPILLDVERMRLDAGLPTNVERVDGERFRLRLAVGAARNKVLLSYPRLDMDQSRPRVPSFYALEALRAAEGTLPEFGDLATRAESAGRSRIGWPAPDNPRDAIDEAEHDLALLEGIMKLPAGDAAGTARYLLSANEHLGRALRFRARRWLRRWTPADGLVHLDGMSSVLPAAREAIARHALDQRSYSPTALQNYAVCPYKFLLYAVYKLSPREVPVAIDEMDPLQRGSLVHEVQYRLMTRLAEQSLLPVAPDNLDEARAVLDSTLDEVAGEYEDDLAPAIERVWMDGIATIRADLREWLRRMTEDESGFVPWRFELAFGLPGSRGRDSHSVREPVALDCGIDLRGSIDLVERHPDGSLRATDYKTGKDISGKEQIVGGGQHLQPVLYALAVEKLVGDGAVVQSGRLHYCTTRGGFGEHTVPLNQRARDAAVRVADTIGMALSGPFLPAAPDEGKCRWCDYRVVCGPYEETRVSRKPPDPLADLRRLRDLP